MHSVVETPTFLSDAKYAGMTEAERVVLVQILADNPQAGEIMVGTGGARKLRFRRPGTGKSGGYRVVTYYAGQDMPVFLLNVFAKGDRANLTQGERNTLQSMLSKLAAIYMEGQKS
jgi:hypothetical protein